MPYQEVYVVPELLLAHNGVEVYYTYKNDDIDQPAMRYHYTNDPESADCDRTDFDVRDLALWPNYNVCPPAPSEARGRLKGYETPAAWQASQDYQKDHARWSAWLETGEIEAIRQTIREAIDQGEIQAYVPAEA